MIYGIDTGFSVVHFNKLTDALHMAERCSFDCHKFDKELRFVLLDDNGNQLRSFLIAEIIKQDRRRLHDVYHHYNRVDDRGCWYEIKACDISTFSDIMDAIEKYA